MAAAATRTSGGMPEESDDTSTDEGSWWSASKLVDRQRGREDRSQGQGRGERSHARALDMSGFFQWRGLKALLDPSGSGEVECAGAELTPALDKVQPTSHVPAVRWSSHVGTGQLQMSTITLQPDGWLPAHVDVWLALATSYLPPRSKVVVRAVLRGEAAAAFRLSESEVTFEPQRWWRRGRILLSAGVCNESVAGAACVRGSCICKVALWMDSRSTLLTQPTHPTHSPNSLTQLTHPHTPPIRPTHSYPSTGQRMAVTRA